MPSFLYKRIADRLDFTYMPFFERVNEMLRACNDRGVFYYAIFGYRSWGEQHQLRMNYLNGTGGKAAPAGLSAHNYGLAMDFAFDANPLKEGLQPGWKPEQYAILGEEAANQGLIWGASFNDRPHVQWPGFVDGRQLELLRKIYQSANVKADEGIKLRSVWNFLDSMHSPPNPSHDIVVKP